MTPPAERPAVWDTVLRAALREVHGPGAQLEAWSADPLTKHGKRRVVRYDVAARLPGAGEVRRHQWVGKFYDREEDARRVAAVLRELAAAGCGAGRGVVVPGVIAYDAPHRILLLTYESGGSLTSAIAREGAAVLAGVGRALAVLHAASVSLDTLRSPATLLADVRSHVADLCARFPAARARLRAEQAALERQAPPPPPAPAFLHGDLGTAQLLWIGGGGADGGRVVVLDFDNCTRGDPALDLGQLFTQLRRLTLRKPGKLADLASLEHGILNAYERNGRHDPDLNRRVAWYARVALLRKIHSLTFGRTRAPGAIERRQAEALRLLDVFDAHAA